MTLQDPPVCRDRVGLSGSPRPTRRSRGCRGPSTSPPILSRHGPAQPSWRVQASPPAISWSLPVKSFCSVSAEAQAPCSVQAKPGAPSRQLTSESTSRSSMSQPNSSSGGSIRPAPIGPPKQKRLVKSRHSQVGSASNSVPRDRQAGSASARANDEAVREMYNKELEAQEKKLAEQNLTLADLQPVIKDTWRPTRAGTILLVFFALVIPPRASRVPFAVSTAAHVEEKARHLIQHSQVSQWVKASSEPKGVADPPSQISDAALGHGC